ncbi:GATA transcription factor 9-like [Curcuma longa]|uniref:GATA transcription factor 9-like n=1 Tax=Curcuma longa TaxID=136217 RepID=UPI003D9F8E0B
MSPFDLNQAATVPVSDGEEQDQIGGHHPSLTPPAAASSCSCLNFSRNHHDHGVVDHGRDHCLKNQILQQEPRDHSILNATDFCYKAIRDISSEMEPSQCKPRGNMKHSTQDHNKSNSSFESSGGPISIRACSNCNTTKTPLWRSGPHGPKSLCNACGIRQRKVRRAMEAAAAAAAVCRVRKEEKPCKSMDHSTVPFKKRYKFTSSSEQKKQLFVGEAVLMPLKDERDAARLLMGLSCGLIRG